MDLQLKYRGRIVQKPLVYCLYTGGASIGIDSIKLG